METPTSPPEPDLHALDRYLAGESTPAEHAVVSAWLAHPHAPASAHGDMRNAMHEKVRALRHIVQRPWPEGAMRSFDEQEQTFWKTVKSAPTDHRSPPHAARRPSGARFAKRLGWQRGTRPGIVVATLLTLVTIGFWFLNRPAITAPSPVTYQTALREQRTVTFADGSRATLAPSTVVRYTNARHVYVNGQAAFSVVGQANHPFVVHTRNAVVQVLGTTFSVRAYPDTSAVRIVVANGRVAVSRVQSKYAPVVVGAGSAVDVLPKTIGFDSHANVAAAMAWTTGRLVFDEMPAAAVFEELRRWYGIDATFADSSLGARRLSFTLYRDTDIETTINLVAAVLNARAEHVGSRMVFHRR